MKEHIAPFMTVPMAECVHGCGAFSVCDMRKLWSDRGFAFAAADHGQWRHASFLNFSSDNRAVFEAFVGPIITRPSTTRSNTKKARSSRLKQLKREQRYHRKYKK